MSGLVSIVMPSYNSSKYISNTIVSIQNQSYKNWELLITDDNSSDNTVEIIKEFILRDNRIKLFLLQENSGAGIARNNSIRMAKGRYIAFCDSDDLWLSNKLEVQLKFIIENKIGFTYSSYFTQDENQNRKASVNAVNEISYKKILQNNYIGCLTAIYDSKILGKMYMPVIRKRQDWALWIKIVEQLGTINGISEPLAVYTIRKDSLSRNKFKLIRYTWIIYREFLGYRIAESFFLLIQFLYFQIKKKLIFHMTGRFGFIMKR